MIQNIQQFVTWLKKNERHLWTAMFVSGFTLDVIAFLPAPLSRANLLFGIYLTLVFLGTVGGYYLQTHDYDKRRHIFARSTAVIVPFIGDFFIGGLLSGLLIFYTKSSAITVSWPFILLLLIVFFGNEIFRDYRKHLAFQLSLVFFTIYAFAIFSLPLALEAIGPRIFLMSGMVSTGAYAVLLLLLGWIEWKRLKESIRLILISGIGFIVVINVSYFSGIIPPLPLTLRDAGVYHSITRTESGYTVQAETDTRAWWQKSPVTDEFSPQVIHLVQGQPLSVYSAVFAPISFSTAIVHEWQWFDPNTHKWVTKADIAFGISGGRDGGYRGYSTLTDLLAGQYRVSIETLSGQIIGRIYFQIVIVSTEPQTQSELK